MKVMRQMAGQHRARALVAALGISMGLTWIAPAQAERPMVVDDAGTLDKGGAKLELGWSVDDEARGFDGAAGYGLIENLEVEVGLAQARDGDPDPSVRLRGVGFAAKWAPLQSETGLSAGLKFDYAREWAKASGTPEETARVTALTGLATWTFGSGAALHLNVGREWVRIDGDTEDEDAWGVGAAYPLSGGLEIAAEVFGAWDGRPDRQVGLRYEVAEGVKLSGAYGRGNDRSFGNVGVAWEF